MCQNTVVIGYTRAGEDIEAKCGSTNQWGGQALCAECEDQARSRYPQGWRDAPGDTCRHGTYVGDAWGPDILCWRCEAE